MAGIYIHIPFCKQQCTYCDFHFSTTFEPYRDNMIAAIAQEIVNRSEYLENKAISTIYFGGGTPSLLSRAELKLLVDSIYEHFTVNDDVEITLESNPDDINNESLSHWIDTGVNRLSIGLQSFRASDLQWMNRAHTVQEALDSVRLAQKQGIDNITVDLIYGLPGLSIEEWEQNIDIVLEMDVPHVSAYCLTVEDKTVLRKWVDSKTIKVATDSEQAAHFNVLCEKLSDSGFEHYEISNFSKPNYRSKHNSAYWSRDWYLGVGPSAHSFNGTTRSWNIANNQGYIQAINELRPGFEVEELSKQDIFNESILTGLRTSKGLDISGLDETLIVSSGLINEMSQFIENEWVAESEGIYTLTSEGKLRADHIAAQLFAL